MDQIIVTLLQILAGPGGQAALQALFTDHGITQEKLDQVLANLKDPPDPKAA